MMMALFLIITSALAGDPRHVINHPGLLAALRAQPPSQWIVCGDDQVRLESKHFAKHFFLGPGKNGVVIRGLSGQSLWDWGHTLTATELNRRLADTVKDARVLVVTDGNSKARVSPAPSQTRIAIPETHVDCLAHGPKTFGCGSAVTRETCCEEGPNKLYGFEVRWPDPDVASVSWRLRYSPGYGNTTLVALGSAEPVRYCITDGMTLLSQSPTGK